MANPLISKINLSNVDYDVADAQLRADFSEFRNSAGRANGYVQLDAEGKIPGEYLDTGGTVPPIIQGNKTIDGKLDVTGKATLSTVEAQSLTTTGNASVGGDLTSEGDLDVEGNFTVGGKLTATSLDLTGNIEAQDGDFAGDLSANNIDIANLTKTKNLKVTDTAEIKKLTVEEIELVGGGNIGGGFRYEEKEIEDLEQLWEDIADEKFTKYNYGNYIKLAGTTFGDLRLMFADWDTFYCDVPSSAYANVQDHHIAAIVLGLPDHNMNSSNTVSGGYAGSAMHSWLNGTVLPVLESAIGASHIIQHQKLLSTSVNNNAVNQSGQKWSGASNDWGWSNQKISLMSECQIYGASIWGNGFDTGEAWKQLEIFKHVNAQQIFKYKALWLRAVGVSTSFAALHDYGVATYYGYASDVSGAFPLILLK